VGIIAVSTIWLYTAATGCESSAIRASVMMTIVLGDWALGVETTGRPAELAVRDEPVSLPLTDTPPFVRNPETFKDGYEHATDFVGGDLFYTSAGLCPRNHDALCQCQWHQRRVALCRLEHCGNQYPECH
jgi:hypothetical protein